MLEPLAAIIVDVGDNDPGRAIVVARGDKAVDNILKLAALDRQLPVFLGTASGLGAAYRCESARYDPRSRLARPPFVTYQQISKCRVTVACGGCRPIRTTVYTARILDRSSFCPSNLSCNVGGQSGQDEWSSLP